MLLTVPVLSDNENSDNENSPSSSDKLVRPKALTSSGTFTRLAFPASLGSENSPAGCSADRTWPFLCQECPVCGQFNFKAFAKSDRLWLLAGLGLAERYSSDASLSWSEHRVCA